MSEPLNKYEYMWDGSSPGWVLVQDDGPGENDEYSIYNKNTKMMCLIEEETVHRIVCEKLVSLGTEVLASIPRAEFRIEDLDIEN